MGTLADEGLVEELITVLRVLRQLTNPVRRGEITAEQYWLLRHLHQQGPQRVTALAAALGIGQSAATTACQRLARQGLLTRRRDDADERVVRVSLTAAGQQRVERWLAARRDILAAVLEPLSTDEQSQLEALLQRVRLSAEDVAHRPQ